MFCSNIYFSLGNVIVKTYLARTDILAEVDIISMPTKFEKFFHSLIIPTVSWRFIKIEIRGNEIEVVFLV